MRTLRGRMPPMTTVPANAVRIPAAAREALARREAVMVLSHGRPAYVLLSPDAYEAASQAPARARRPSSSAAPPPPQGRGSAENTTAPGGGAAGEPLDPWEHS